MGWRADNTTQSATLVVRGLGHSYWTPPWLPIPPSELKGQAWMGRSTAEEVNVLVAVNVLTFVMLSLVFSSS